MARRSGIYVRSDQVPTSVTLEALPVHGGLRDGLAMGLVAATVVVFELTLTRLLSVVLWYHWAFFAVSVAMLGLALPGVLFALVQPRPGWATHALAGAGIAVPLTVVVIIQGARAAGGSAILVCFAAALPAFFLLGTATCLLLLGLPGARVARIYGADLIGAAVGALGMVPLLSVLPTPVATTALGILPLAALVLMRPRAAPLALPGFIVIAVTIGWGAPLRIRHTKTYVEGGGGIEPIQEVWSPTVRLTTFDHVLFASSTAPFAWGPGTLRSAARGPGEIWVEQDGSAGTPITRFSGDFRQLQYLFDDVTAVAYEARRPERVAVIGAGGGRDVLTALAAGAEQVMAIELHPELIALVNGPYGAYSGHLYDRPDVTAVAGDGRTVLARHAGRFDLVQLSLIDSWAATAAGAYTLAENHLYTIEAFRLYWSRLTPHGMVSASRWMRGGFGLELPRLVLLAKAALLAEGVADPASHVAVVQGAAVGTVLVARSPFTEGELASLGEAADQRGFVVHFPVAIATPERALIAHIFNTGPAAYAKHGLRMDPPTDDRPFFFQTVSPFAALSRAAALDLGVNGEGVWALQRLLVTVVLAAVGLLFLPFFFAAHFERGTLARGTTYFGVIGLAFFAVELAWLARSVLVLGHPTLAATVVLGSLLLGSGVGSLVAERIGLGGLQRGGLGVVAVVIATTAFLVWLGGPTAPAGWLERVVGVALGTGLAGVGMGAFFPLGLVRFGDGNKAWFWAVNGAASVVSAVGVVALTMEIGIRAVALLGAALYAVAVALLQGRAAVDDHS
ncbi:MAG: hypothetical protein JW751_27720 [Polyangiaceae bacterium]|nr:hypothetical protein [Polyangiaceae bacterium]